MYKELHQTRKAEYLYSQMQEFTREARDLHSVSIYFFLKSRASLRNPRKKELNIPFPRTALRLAG